MKVKNPLNDEAIVFDIIAEYNQTLKNIEEVDALLEKYKNDKEENMEVENTYKDILKGPKEQQQDVLKDDESLDF